MPAVFIYGLESLMVSMGEQEKAKASELKPVYNGAGFASGKPAVRLTSKGDPL